MSGFRNIGDYKRNIGDYKFIACTKYNWLTSCFANDLYSQHCNKLYYPLNAKDRLLLYEIAAERLSVIYELTLKSDKRISVLSNLNYSSLFQKNDIHGFCSYCQELINNKYTIYEGQTNEYIWIDSDSVFQETNFELQHEYELVDDLALFQYSCIQPLQLKNQYSGRLTSSLAAQNSTSAYDPLISCIEYSYDIIDNTSRIIVPGWNIPYKIIKQEDIFEYKVNGQFQLSGPYANLNADTSKPYLPPSWIYSQINIQYSTENNYLNISRFQIELENIIGGEQRMTSVSHHRI